MAWSTIRPATDDDIEKLNQAAVRFIARHKINNPASVQSVKAVEWAIEQENESYPGEFATERKLWRAIVRRDLGSRFAEGIAYGYVGVHHN